MRLAAIFLVCLSVVFLLHKWFDALPPLREAQFTAVFVMCAAFVFGLIWS